MGKQFMDATRKIALYYQEPLKGKTMPAVIPRANI